MDNPGVEPGCDERLVRGLPGHTQSFRPLAAQTTGGGRLAGAASAQSGPPSNETAPPRSRLRTPAMASRSCVSLAGRSPASTTLVSPVAMASFVRPGAAMASELASSASANGVRVTGFTAAG